MNARALPPRNAGSYDKSRLELRIQAIKLVMAVYHARIKKEEAK